MTDEVGVQLDLSDLEPFAERVAGRIASAFPEYATLIGRDGGELWMEIPCPSPAVERGLFVGTRSDDEDVSVGFHTYHGHSQDWFNIGTDDFLEDAVAQMRRIVEERLVVVAIYSDGEYARSWLDEPADALSQLKGVAKEVLGWKRLLRLVKLPTPRLSLTLRSWLGTHDVDLDRVR